MAPFLSGHCVYIMKMHQLSTKLSTSASVSHKNTNLTKETSVSETIRKPSLIKAQTALRQEKNEIWRKRFSMWRTEFLHPAIWHDHDNDFARWLHPAMWHVTLESGQWIHQVAVSLPCNVKCVSGMTCHRIRQVAAPSNVALESWQWIRPVAAPCNVACGSIIITVNSPSGK